MSYNEDVSIVLENKTHLVWGYEAVAQQEVYDDLR